MGKFASINGSNLRGHLVIWSFVKIENGLSKFSTII